MKLFFRLIGKVLYSVFGLKKTEENLRQSTEERGLKNRDPVILLGGKKLGKIA
jgi:hypothetical protein